MHISSAEHLRFTAPLRQLPASSHRVPARITAKLSETKSCEGIQSLLQGVGLTVLEVEATPSAFLARIALPSAILELIPNKESYFSPQIKFPRFASADLPFGTVLLNCLMPPLEELDSAEKVFSAYVDVLAKLSQALEATPVACYTGIKGDQDQGKNDLFERSFRFFFSSDPAGSTAAIETIVALYMMPKPETAQERKFLYNEKVNARYRRDLCAPPNSRPIPHPILEDVMPMIKTGLLLRFGDQIEAETNQLKQSA
ncbi:MAG: hypothetical protein KKC80_06195 [Candidatus Margulisbacteria bacterium]|nr:hypothetical protein [Candidatus Margulisiibacteriota bacterium]MBU1616921.1 hypothetical protein [Candidatus Margulisiibacteriota bacterium]